MKKVILIVVALLLVTVVVWRYANRSGKAPAAATLLPDTTVLFLDVPDFRKSQKQFERTQAYALWQEPEVQAFLEKPRAALRDLVGAGKNDSAATAFLQDRALNLPQGEVFLAITHVSPPPLVQAGVVFGADVKQNRLEAQAFLKVVEHDLSKRFPAATSTDKRYLGTTYTIWQLAEHQQICHAFLNSLLVCTMDEEVMRDVVTRFTGEDPKSLAASAAYRTVIHDIPAGHESVAFLNLEQLLGVFGPLLAMAPQGGGMIQKLAGIRTAATSTTIADELIEDVSLVGYSGNKHIPDPAIDRRTLALTSPDTTLYLARAMNLAGSYRGMMDTIAQSGNATMSSAAAQFDRNLSQHGLHLADVLAKIGPEVALLSVWRDGASFPDVAAVAELKNAAQARPDIDTAMQAFGTAWDTQPYLGETLHTFALGAGMVAPSYVVSDKFLIVASRADYARTLVSQMKNPGPTLAGNADFAKAVTRVPASGSSFTFCDVRRVFSALYALAQANKDTVQVVDLGKMPRPETLAKHLSPYISATLDTAELQTTTTYSSLGKPLTIVTGLAGVIGAAQPYLMKVAPNFIPGLPTMSSGTVVPPSQNQTAPSQTPATR